MLTDLLLGFVMVLIPMTAMSFSLLYLVDKYVDEDDENEPQGIKAKALDLLNSKWVSFGGGFYGLAALVTFFVIEALEVISFVSAATGIDYFIDAISISTLIAIFVESFTNMIDAIIWFTYWPDKTGIGNAWIWLIMAYAGYQLGEFLADQFTDD